MKMDKVWRRIALHAEIARQVKPQFADYHIEMLDRLEADLPSGSGLDSGCTIDREISGENKVVIHTAYHHIRDGYYVGWTTHKVILTPSLSREFNIRITGRNRDQVKDYLYDLFLQYFDHSKLAFNDHL